MRERPILFSASMVHAILDDRKTMTRRALNEREHTKFAAAADLGECGRFLEGQTITPADRTYHSMLCRYGEPGDRLYVRETFQPIYAEGSNPNSANYKTGEGYAISYPATDGRIEFVDADDEVSDRCKPAIHMPRWASRILLEITSTRVERLHDITKEDSISEGIYGPYGSSMGIPFTARDHFQALWSGINGEESWYSNPWVWVVGFRRIEAAS